jgi:hypothetical protein
MLQAGEVTNEAVNAADSTPRQFDALRLKLLDWDALWFDLERFRRQRHLDNLTLKHASFAHCSTRRTGIAWPRLPRCGRRT